VRRSLDRSPLSSLANQTGLVARTYLEHPDSSCLLAPRIFTRVFCQPGQLIETVRFYQELSHERLDMDMDIPEAGLHVVAVGSFSSRSSTVEGRCSGARATAAPGIDTAGT
jgi:hypothetical protein